MTREKSREVWQKGMERSVFKRRGQCGGKKREDVVGMAIVRDLDGARTEKGVERERRRR